MKRIIALILFSSFAVVAFENFDSVVSVSSSAGGSTIAVANANRTVLCLQNVEVSIEYCAKGANIPTTAAYGFSLAPASGSGNADGGFRCFSGQPAAFLFTCIAATGTGKIARTSAGR